MAGSILLRSNETSWGPAEIDFFASDNAIPSDNEFSRSVNASYVHKVQLSIETKTR